MTDKSTMKRELQAVSGFRALIISKYATSFALALSFLYLGYLRYALSPLYILIVIYALPPILSFALKDFKERYHNKFLAYITEDKSFLLTMLKGKYRYTRLSYITNSVSYIFSLLLIYLWQYNYSHSEFIQSAITYLPISILTGSIMVRIISIIYYRIKLPYDLTHNRV